MQDYYFSPEKLRFHLTKPDTLILRGWYWDDNPDNGSVEIYLDGKKLEFSEEKKRGVEIRQKYLTHRANINEELVYEITLPNDWKEKHTLQVKCRRATGSKTVLSYSVKNLIKATDTIEYYIEAENLSEGQVTVSGWAMSEGEIDFTVFDASGKKLDSRLERYYRKDVASVYEEVGEEREAGFTLAFEKGQGKAFTILFSDGKRREKYRNSYAAVESGNRRNGGDLIQKIKNYYQRNGFEATLRRVKTKLLNQPEKDYNHWRKHFLLTEHELDVQRNTDMAGGPKFSVVIPVSHPPKKYLCAMVDSILAQTYENWELCLSDGSGKDSTLKPLLEKYRTRDKRISYRMSQTALNSSDNTNAALEMVSGDYVVFAEQDDIMSPNALYECAKAIRNDSSIDMIYTDEDKVNKAGKYYFEPNFKPDINIDLLRSMNYIHHLCVIKKELLDNVGAMRSAFEGAQEYDFILRCVEKAGHIHHIPKALYHWRCYRDSRTSDSESKSFAVEAGRRALEEHYKRMGIPAKVECSNHEGIYHTVYQWKEQPLISVLIPNKDHCEDLKKCIDSLLEKSTYRNFEIVIIENNSTEESTFAYYTELLGKPYTADEPVETVLELEDKAEAGIAIRLVTWKGIFNYSAINNFGAEYAKGAYFLLLNNDTELISPDALKEMLGYCMREDVGIVGAKLNYEDDTIQHAGVVVGFGGVAGHTFVGASRYDLGYQSRIACAQDYSAVTAACLMTDRATFEAVGGLSEELQVAFNDTDYCMKVRTLGKLVVYNPYVELYHYESKSRGLDNTPEKAARFMGEVATFQRKWSDILENGDPYFNPNLSLDKSDFSLK